MQHSKKLMVLIEGWGGGEPIFLLLIFTISHSLTASTLNNSYPMRSEQTNVVKPPAVLQEEIRIWSFHYLKILHWFLIALRIKHKLLYLTWLTKATISCLHQRQRYRLNIPSFLLHLSFLAVIGAGDL